jgi:ATP/maltotriose-dependent transcriptional regulator MalT
MGRLGEAAAQLDRAADLAERTDDVELHGHVALERGRLAYLRGDAPAALAHVEAALQIGQQIGSGAILGPTLTLMGALRLLRQQWDQAVDILEMIGARTERGRAAFTSIILAYLAEAYLGAGDLARARATADAAVERARRVGTRGYEGRALLAQVRIMLRSEGAAAAERLEAIFASIDALLTETAARGMEPYVRLERAELARLCGDQHRRERELRAARSGFAAMESPAMVARIDALLGAG